MAANGGGPPFMDVLRTRGVKKEEIDPKPIWLDQNHIKNNDDNNNNKGISIAERRAAKCGFNVSNMNENRFRTGGLMSPVRSPYFTIPPGISPSALLDSPIMLPNAQAQLSPTTGTFQFPTPNPESLKLKPKLFSTNQTDQSSSNTLKVENKLFEEFENMQKMASKDNFEDSLDKSEYPNSNADNFGRNQMSNRNIDNSSKEKHPRTTYETAKYSEDGYYWRKYGQKHVKGSEFPRSYYKCTNTNCVVKKKVERSHDGQITEIVYKGSHNHLKPQSFNRFCDMSEITQGSGSCIKNEAGHDDYGLDVLASSTSLFNDLTNPLSTTLNTFEPVESQEFSSKFNDQDEASLESISINDEDGDNGECEPKRRKKDSFPNEMANPRSTREPKVVVQIESDIDILDDGYRWRKYGQKVVKGNPNPRSYYKCTTPGCPVRKHVERAADDIKSVITTYEGKHNHQVPSSKPANLVISDVANNKPSSVANSTTPSRMTQKQDATNNIGYMDRKPILNYNGLMRSNLPSTFTGDHLNFGASSIYPLSFPPFHSLHYGSLMMNGSHMKPYPSPNLYPMLSDYMSLPSVPMNHVIGSAGVSGNNFHLGNYSTMQNSVGGQEIRECHSKNMKPKEEKRDVYDGYPNHGNGTTM